MAKPGPDPDLAHHSYPKTQPAPDVPDSFQPYSRRHRLLHVVIAHRDRFRAEVNGYQL